MILDIPKNVNFTSRVRYAIALCKVGAVLGQFQSKTNEETKLIGNISTLSKIKSWRCTKTNMKVSATARKFMGYLSDDPNENIQKFMKPNLNGKKIWTMFQPTKVLEHRPYSPDLVHRLTLYLESFFNRLVREVDMF